MRNKPQLPQTRAARHRQFICGSSSDNASAAAAIDKRLEWPAGGGAKTWLFPRYMFTGRFTDPVTDRLRVVNAVVISLLVLGFLYAVLQSFHLPWCNRPI